MHPETQDSDDVDPVPLYEEQYVPLSPADYAAAAGTSTLVWRDAAQLPLAMLTADSGDRQVIDAALPTTRSRRSRRSKPIPLLRRSHRCKWHGVHRSAHWLWQCHERRRVIRVELVDPVLKAQIALATNALGPGIFRLPERS